MSWNPGADSWGGGEDFAASGGNWGGGDDAPAAQNWGGEDAVPQSNENANPTGDDDNKCRNCGADDHFARQCPEPRKAREGMACFNCGEEGHTNMECTEPRKAREGMACFNCGEEGHTNMECTEPRKAREGMACFNCGEEGHTKMECTQPRVFKGACRICNQEGHPAFECPERPPDVCKNCKTEGHQTMECKENRKFDLNHIADMLPEVAWAILKKASDERDMEDFREGLKVYSKAAPDATFADIERKMREESFKVYLIALESSDTADCISLINLQGKLDCTYSIGFFFSPKPQRGNLRDRWPPSIEENLERLEDAGLPYDRQVPKCGNCGEMGHTARGCKEERAIIERVEVKCVNCNEAGHRARDCTQPRVDRFACRNCGSSEHKAAECPLPRSAAGIECKRCNEMGHFAKDCPQAPEPRTCRNCGSEDHIAKDCDQPRDISTVTCRNCDEVGHYSRDCPQKRDYSRVKCNNCGEMGHTVTRCQAPSAEEAPQDNVDTGGYNGGGNDGW